MTIVLYAKSDLFMQKFISIISSILITLFVLNAMAEPQYDWLLRDSKKTEKDIAYETGYIDGQQYIARIINGINSEEKVNEVIFISTLNHKRHEFIAVIDLQGDYAEAYKVKIKNNSIYITHGTAHHGVYFSRYQFKKRGKIFQLVGIESQSITLSGYGVSEQERNKPDYKTLEMWAGESINILTSEAECWLQAYPIGDKQGKIASARFAKILPATKGVRKTVRFKPVKSFSLNNFDFYNDNLNNWFTCYFDHNMKFHGK